MTDIIQIHNAIFIPQLNRLPLNLNSIFLLVKNTGVKKILYNINIVSITFAVDVAARRCRYARVEPAPWKLHTLWLGLVVGRYPVLDTLYYVTARLYLRWLHGDRVLDGTHAGVDYTVRIYYNRILYEYECQCQCHTHTIRVDIGAYNARSSPSR